MFNGGNRPSRKLEPAIDVSLHNSLMKFLNLILYAIVLVLFVNAEEFTRDSQVYATLS